MLDSDGDSLCAEELPIRLAHRVRELDQLPYNLHNSPSINKVKHWYAQSFEVSYYLVVCAAFGVQTKWHAQTRRSLASRPSCVRSFTRLSRTALLLAT